MTKGPEEHFKTTVENQTFFQSFLSQLVIMMRRNTILQYRYLNATLAQVVIAPFIFTLLIFILQVADHNNQSISNPHPTLGALDGVYRCQGRNPGDPCVSILYYPDTTVDGVNYTQILSTFAAKNAERTGETPLSFETPMTRPVFSLSSVIDIAAVPDASYIYDFTIQNPNKTAWGITFNQTGSGSSINIQYQLWFNASATTNGSDIFGRSVLSFVRGLDEAIISTLNDPTGEKVVDITVNMKDWPLIPPTTLSDSIVQELGPVFFFCSEMLIFINVLNQIVTEKEFKLRHGMEVMGLKPAVYWLSHLISNTILVFLNALFSVIWGLIFQFQAYLNTNFFILFFTFFLFGEAMVMFAFFITTLVRTTRVAILIGIFIFIIGLLFESFVFSGSYIGYIWWSPQTIDPAGWKGNAKMYINLLVLVLIFFPFFNFGRMFLDITTLTTGLLDTLTQTYIPGPGFGWSDLYKAFPNSSLPVYGLNGPPAVPPPADTWNYLIMDCFFYGFILWFLDNVIPNEFGMSRPLWFFLTPDYWEIETSASKSISVDQWQSINGAMGQPAEENEDEDVVAERKRALDPQVKSSLKIVNLRKVYRSVNISCSCFSSNSKPLTETKVAVRNSCFTVEEGKLLALLGQNGAGKSTTISMLSGLTPATAGDALIYNLSVKSSMLSIRKLMGICPQHDILFDDLTAREHIQLYAGLKGVPKEQWEPLIQERLQFVRLLSVADVRAGTYSGGMKRRLSLVIATIGDPKIIFLDEPTTGMDPVNRRHVWSFIEKFKKNRIIILTTHSMEEADVLGDRVCIMSKGRLRAINNSIALKNKYGEGYRVSVVTDKAVSENVKSTIKKFIPNATLEDDAAGALIYKFPASSLDKIPEFVNWLESNKDGYVKSWGISQSTLEEVFLKLIRESNTLFS